MLKQNKGITLVALVVTIIVLLILAGVSISLVVGQNGVLSQAQNSSKKTAVAQAQQDLEMALSSVQGDFIDTWNTNTTSKLQDYVNEDRIQRAYSGDDATKATIKYTFTAAQAATETEAAQPAKGKVEITVNSVVYEMEFKYTENDVGLSITSPLAEKTSSGN